MRNTRKAQPQQVAESALQPDEAALVERFRRLKDKQKNFVSRIVDDLVVNEAAPPRAKVEHVLLAVKWGKHSTKPVKIIERCTGLWENPTGPRFTGIPDYYAGTVPIEDRDSPGSDE
jgi:hypothetical protein